MTTDPPSYAQFGEDDRISELLELIGVGDKRCCEFGAFDGLDCSNTARFWRHEGWHATLVEADPARFDLLAETTAPHHNVAPILAAVSPSNVSEMLPGPWDISSVDLDGDDFAVVEAWTARPRILCVEYNQSIPYWMDVRQTKLSDRFGCSAEAWRSLLEPRGYVLQGVTDCNLIWVHDSHQYPVDWGTTGWPWLSGSLDANYRKHATYLVTDYDGRPVPIGAQPPWGLRWDDRCDYELTGARKVWAT